MCPPYNSVLGSPQLSGRPLETPVPVETGSKMSSDDPSKVGESDRLTRVECDDQTESTDSSRSVRAHHSPHTR